LWVVALPALFLLVFAGILGGGRENARGRLDQDTYHWMVIEQFSRQWPEPDLTDYRSATGPGYHLPLAWVHRFVTENQTAIRVVGAVWTILLLGSLGREVGYRIQGIRAIAVCLPMVVSLYVVVSGVYLLPDNLAWLTVLGLMVLAFRPKVDAWTYLGGAALLAVAVFVRQINLWPAGVLAVAAAMPGWRESSELESHLAPPLSPWWGVRTGVMIVAALPAVAVLMWFYSMWGGLTPPAFQSVAPSRELVPAWHSGWQHEGPNPAVPAMILAVLGTTGVFYGGFFWPKLREVWESEDRRLALLAGGLLLGAMAASIVPTTWNEGAGRYSGLWNVSRAFPTIGERSLLMIALATVGGGVLALGFMSLGRRARWIWLTAWVCFIAAQTANAMAWQKYYEPFCLMMLPLAASRIVGQRPVPRWAFFGPLLLAILLAGVTVWSFRGR